MNEEETENLTNKEYQKKFYAQILIMAIALILIIAFFYVYTNKNQEPTTPTTNSIYGVKDWNEVCGDFDGNLTFNHAIFKDDQQLVCVFDNHVEPFIDINNEKWTNPEYKVCYRLFSLLENKEWEYNGQTC